MNTAPSSHTKPSQVVVLVPPKTSESKWKSNLKENTPVIGNTSGGSQQQKGKNISKLAKLADSGIPYSPNSEVVDNPAPKTVTTPSTATSIESCNLQKLPISRLTSPCPDGNNSVSKSPNSTSPKIIDTHQLEQRQKQIEYGHQTLGYIRFRLLVPKEKRTRDDPRTPKKIQACSKRSWDGQIKKWRRDLHKWDPDDPSMFLSWLESDFVNQIIKNNLGPEILDLLQKIKERAAKFENSPEQSPSLSPSPVSHVQNNEKDLDDLEEENIVRKLVF